MIDWLLIYKNIKGEANENEKLEYSTWLQKSFKHKHYVDKFDEYCRKDGEFKPLSQEHLRAKFNKITSHVDEISTTVKSPQKKNYSTKKITYSITAVAAAMVISFTLYILNLSREEVQNVIAETQQFTVPTLILDDGDNIKLDGVKEVEVGGLVRKIADKKISYLQNNAKSKVMTKVHYNKAVIPSCYTYTIILDDGTEVFLNANSELRYPITFVGDEREVFLRGEAYFKVIKNEKPFIVTTDDISVKVYGTEFNINAYNNDCIETVLVSGSVGVTAKGENEILIKPNQIISIDKSTNKSIVKTVVVDNYISWKSGYFRYIDYSFTDVMNDMASWYGIRVKLSDGIKAQNMLTTLSISRNIPLEEALRFIETIMSVKIINKGGGHYSVE